MAVPPGTPDRNALRAPRGARWSASMAPHRPGGQASLRPSRCPLRGSADRCLALLVRDADVQERALGRSEVDEARRVEDPGGTPGGVLEREADADPARGVLGVVH